MEKPQTLRALAASLGEPLQRILVQCVFCGAPMTWPDKVAFENKCLSVVWCRERFFGACVSCTNVRSYWDVLNNRGPTLEATGVESLFNKPLSDIPVRCMYCLAQLTVLEKIACAVNERPFVLVRKLFRNTCSECTQYDRS
ncbi:E6 [Leptonychotes weddellii papillomavirus 5]|uniref:Protein E6 n=1 Tax=Leptonychotes weddellii papillomavirus 5 TaxID=2077306 RepID=A0A2I8B2Q0_9PAPI|nr:E6 [Leptonychotes weddellii papillomavirus 5]AUT11917.1 E6 [Leptonychotes weddellii papillomavirus 5]